MLRFLCVAVGLASLAAHEAPPQQPPAVGSPVAIGGAGRFRLRVSPGDEGFLYVFAEPLAQAPLYVLFPSETANEGRSAVRQGVTLGVPESSWLMFGPRRGLHRLWLVWSRKPMPDLEATTVWANGNDAGEIRDDGQRARVRATLAPVPASLDAQSGEYRLAGRADVMSGYIDFKR